MRRSLFVLLAGILGSVTGLGALPASGQSGLAARCESSDVQELGARTNCLATVQALRSAQPSAGILIAGGNPTLGSTGGTGFRLGILPRVSVGLRMNVVAVRLPGILSRDPADDEPTGRRFSATLPAFTGDASLALNRGFSLAPGLEGTGALSLLGSVGYAPLSLFDDGFDDVSNPTFGVGARLHLLEESFVAPGVSLSLMRRSLDDVQLGDICDAGLTDLQGSNGPDGLTTGACASDGDPGELLFDITSWSTRLVAGKHLLGLGVTGGIGYDRYRSNAAFGFRGSTPLPGTDVAPGFRVSDRELSSSRWSAFGNLSYTLLVGTLGLEAGWQQGSSPIPGFQEIESDFDPRAGTWFGSIGARLAL